ncbi:unnamed protein product [Chrysodeixis includens]|uniref:Rhythmically expressed gene 2 protein n=1 Tax=Chrysodeixis includens TaxID=689277 RepID=A0A9P0BJR4_CHRIL|nr:unnamed protein product [Chrysodeixis includens]
MCLRGMKLVTFDVTNTLLNFRLPPWQYYITIAKTYPGYTGSDDDVKTKFRQNFKNMWIEYPNFGKSSIQWENWWRKVVALTLSDHLPANTNMDDLADKVIEEFKTDKCWEVAQGSNRLISHLRSLGLSIGVISNFDPRLNGILQSVGIYDQFDFILASYEFGHSKPDKRIFEKAIELCQKPLAPSEALHIGDDVQKDYEGARAAGWHAVLINKQPESENQLRQDHVFKDLNDLILNIEQDKLKL